MTITWCNFVCSTKMRRPQRLFYPFLHPPLSHNNLIFEKRPQIQRPFNVLCSLHMWRCTFENQITNWMLLNELIPVSVVHFEEVNLRLTEQQNHLMTSGSKRLFSIPQTRPSRSQKKGLVWFKTCPVGSRGAQLATSCPLCVLVHFQSFFFSFPP